jgi:hypothetical protein
MANIHTTAWARHATKSLKAKKKIARPIKIIFQTMRHLSETGTSRTKEIL